jgi:hypothetical protein
MWSQFHGSESVSSCRERGRRSGTTFLRFATVPMVALLAIGTTNALPGLTSAAVEPTQAGWYGTITATYEMRYSLEATYSNEVVRTGTVTYRIQPVGGLGYHAAEMEVDQTTVNGGTCAWNGVYMSDRTTTRILWQGTSPGDATGPAPYPLSLTEADGDVLYEPLQLSLPADNSTRCTRDGELQVTSWPDDVARLESHNDTPTRLRVDLDPDPDRLVGNDEWTLAAPPDGGLRGGITQWTSYRYAVTYDLSRTGASCTGNSPPVASFKGMPLDWRNGRRPTNPHVRVRLESTSLDPEGDRLTEEWTFADASVRRAGGASVESRWATNAETPTQRTVTLRVTDSCGAASEAAFAAFRITGDPNRDFAPIATLHPYEEYFPMRAGRFIAKSSLKYALPNRPDRIVHRNPKAVRLGRGSYPVKHGGITLKTDDLTRPHLLPELPGEEPWCSKCGYYLKLPTKLQKGVRPPDAQIRVPMYVQEVRDKRVYWMFYGLSQATLIGGAPVKGIKHQGDWERVIVDLDATYQVPQRIGFVAHHDPVNWKLYRPFRSTPPADVNTSTLNPRAYVSRLGHGTWPSVGRHKACKHYVLCVFDYTTVNGFTWDGSLQQTPITKQSWFGRPSDHRPCKRGAPTPRNGLRCGFGGAWGDAGFKTDTTGPLGPSSYKRAVKN